MQPMARAILESFRFTNRSIPLAVDDLDRSQLVHRLRSGDGPSILWHLGHMMHYRIVATNRLGVERQSPYDVTFNENGASDGSDYPSLESMLTQWGEIHAALEAALEGATDASLLDHYMLPNGTKSARTLLGAMTFYTWHEASHMGGITVIRVEVGAPSIAERAFGPSPKK